MTQAERVGEVALSVGAGGWVAVEHQGRPRTLLRVAPDDAAQYRIVELHLSGSPLTPTDLRSIRLGWVERILNLPEYRSELARSLKSDGIRIEQLAKHFNTTSWGTQYRIGSLLDDSGLPAGVVKAVDPDLRRRKAFNQDTVRQQRTDLATFVVEQRRLKRTPLVKPSSKRFPGFFYLQVAAAYREALRQGAQPTPFIAAESGVPLTAAARWVKEARRRGYLGAGRQGRSGEAPELAVRYVGPSIEVFVPLPDGREPRVKRGDVLNVPTDVALGLLEQEENWQPVPREGT